MTKKENMDKQDELFVVVDKNDKIVGYRTRYDCHHNKQLIHRTIGIVVFNDQGQPLLQKRSRNKDLYPGLYTVSASGHVNKGETYLQTAKRELMEELGIAAPLQKRAKLLVKLEQETEMGCLFSAKHNGPFYPEKNDIDEVRFVTPTELKQMRSQLTPFAITNLKKLRLL